MADTRMPTTTTTTAPTTLCQRNATLVKAFAAADGAHAGDQADERPVAGRALPSDREEEDAEDRAVEERAEAVDHFDQRAQLRGEDRDDDAKMPQNAVASLDTTR